MHFERSEHLEHLCNDLLMVIRIQTTLVDTFTKLLVDRVNNLKHKYVENILIDDIGDIIPESEDNIIETTKSLTHK